MISDPTGQQWLKWIAGTQNTPGQIAQLRHPYNEGGASAVLVLVAQSIIRYVDTGIRRLIHAVVSFQEHREERHEHL